MIGASVGLSNAAASIAIGCAGVSRRTRVRIAVVFFCFESAMPLVGLVAGERLATGLGSGGRWLGGAVLVGVGIVALSPVGRRGDVRVWDRLATPKLLVAGFVLGLDNLVVGFALGTFGVPVLLAALTIGSVSVTMSLGAMWLGGRLGREIGTMSETVGAGALIVIGILVVLRLL